MANLRECFESDMSTFFSSNEFATIHQINGKDMEIVLDNDMLDMQKLKLMRKDGIFRGEILFYVKKSVFGEKPAEGQIISFDGKKKRVYECREDDGMYTITLEANRS